MSTPHIDILVVGASGRMGRRIVALAQEHPRWRLVGALTRDGSPSIGRPVGERGTLIAPMSAGATRADVVVDFSTPAGALEAAALAERLGAALVTGTTGLDRDQESRLRAFAGRIPVLCAANMSPGVAVMTALVRQAARLLGTRYRACIVEAHHAQKKDAPSGTAKRLAEAVRAVGGELSDDQVVSIRGGDVVGEHTVRLAGPGEYLEITHRAMNRDLFALGALRAAEWLVGKPAGWYLIEDVVGVAGPG